MQRINFEDLPDKARKGFSKRQIGNIDEFDFFRLTDDRIEARYCEMVRHWDGERWMKDPEAP